MPTALPSLEELGWSEHFAQKLEALERSDLYPGRVCMDRGILEAMRDGRSRRVRASGRLRHEAKTRRDLPTIGDWVALDDKNVIQHILERRSAFVRATPERRGGVQVVAANVDIVFVVTSLNQDLNLRRLERYVAATWDAGAVPVVLLNKADLVDDAADFVERVRAVVPGVDVDVTAAKDDALEPVRQRLTTGRTFAFLGSSGVGKSTMVNALLGEEIQRVKEVRETDDKGRHTTTHRALFVLEGGGVLIDTPGMRELQLVGMTGLDDTFQDVLEFAADCHFRDCSHSGEPGCNVAGNVPDDRLRAYARLQHELEAERRRNNPSEQRRYERAFARIVSDAKRQKQGEDT